MSALRRAGVWLGLIEDDDDRAYGYDDRSYDEEYPDDEFGDAGTLVRNRVAGRLAQQRAAREEQAAQAAMERAEARRSRAADRPTEAVQANRGGVRSLGRSDADGIPVRRSGDAGSYPVRDNLALAPEPFDPPEPPVVARATVAIPVTPVTPVLPPTAAVPDDRRYSITTLHPATFSDARTIGEQFRNGVLVILNLTEMSEADAKRLVDFAAGLAFGLRGSMERVANRVFLLSPANIQVTAEDKQRIAEGGFFYQ